MNRITVAVFSSLLVGILAMPGFGFAQNQPVKVAANEMPQVKSVGLLPTSPFYFLKEASRGIQSFFTFDQVKKAELKLRFADEKLVEAKAVSEQEPQNETAIKKAFDNYESNAAELKTRLEGLSSKSENPNVQKLLEKVAVREIKHKELFEMLTLKPEIKNNFPRLVSLLPEKIPESKGIKVISPIGGEKWMIGKTYLIKWQIKPALTAITPVDIYLDKGIECFTVPCENRLEIAKNISSDTQYSWTIPLNLSSFPRARVFIEAVGNREQFGISHYFSIISSNNQTQASFNGLLEASGPGFQMWGTHKLSVKEVVYCVKAPCPPIEKSYLVKASNNKVLVELERYEGKNVTVVGEAKYYDIEGGFWGIVAESVSPAPTPPPVSTSAIKIISPAAGDKWIQGKTYKIIWKAPELIKTVFINLDTGIRCARAPCPEAGFNIAKNVPALDGSYSWTIPKDLSPNSKVRIIIGTTGAGNEGKTGISDSFEIVSSNQTSIKTDLHKPCSSNESCSGSAQCLSYYGVAGTSGPKFSTCEIPCKSNFDCPTDLICGDTVDGPGRVCN